MRTPLSTTALACLLALIVWTTAPGVNAQDFDAVQIQRIDLGDGLAMLVGAGGNIGVSAGPDGVFLVDDQAEPVSGSTTTAILAKAMLERSPGGLVVHNLICSRAVPEVIRESGGTPIRTRVGRMLANRTTVGSVPPPRR